MVHKLTLKNNESMGIVDIKLVINSENGELGSVIPDGEAAIKSLF